MTRAAAFTQGDISKVLKGAKAAGFNVSSVVVDPTGRIVAQLGKAEDDRPIETELDRLIRAQKEQASPQRHRVSRPPRKLARSVQG
jgi:hypothetical protein